MSGKPKNPKSWVSKPVVKGKHPVGGRKATSHPKPGLTSPRQKRPAK